MYRARGKEDDLDIIMTTRETLFNEDNAYQSVHFRPVASSTMAALPRIESISPSTCG